MCKRWPIWRIVCKLEKMPRSGRSLKVLLKRLLIMVVSVWAAATALFTAAIMDMRLCALTLGVTWKFRGDRPNTIKGFRKIPKW